MSGKKEPTLEPIAFVSDRMRLMAPFLSPNAIALGQRRVFEKGFRIIRRVNGAGEKERIERAEGTDADLKGALLVAKQINPAEIFNGEEDSLYRGSDRKTISGMRARGELAED